MYKPMYTIVYFVLPSFIYSSLSVKVCNNCLIGQLNAVYLLLNYMFTILLQNLNCNAIAVKIIIYIMEH